MTVSNICLSNSISYVNCRLEVKFILIDEVQKRENLTINNNAKNIILSKNNYVKSNLTEMYKYD